MDKSPNRKLSAATLIGALRRRVLYLLIPAAVLAGAAWIYARRMPQNYRARVEIAAEPVVPASYLSDRPAVAPVLNVQDQLRSIRDVLLSPLMLSRVIGEVDTYDRAHGAVASHAASEQAVSEMKSNIQVQVESPDSFFVTLEGPRPAETMEAVNRLAENFVEKTSSLLGQRTLQVDNFLDTEVAQLRRQLDQQEQGLAAYKQSVSQALPDRVATNLRHVESIQQEIQAETDHIAEAQARRSAITDELKTLDKQGALQPEPVAKTTMENALDDARIKLRQLRARYTAQNPLIAEADREVKDLEAAVAAQTKVPRPASTNQMHYIALQAEMKSIGERIKSYGQERDSLTAELQQAETQVNASPGYEGTMDRLGKDAAVTRSRYEALLAKQQEAKLDQKAGQAGNGILYKIVEPASLPTSPAGPKRYQIVLLGLIAGLGMGFGAILLREQMDSSFGTVEEFQGYTNLPVLAAVPTISTRPIRMRPAAKSARPRLVSSHPFNAEPSNSENGGLDRKHLLKHRLTMMSDPHSVPAEQYRILSLKVLQWLRQDGQKALAPWKDSDSGKVLAVTSAAGGEGKSVTALNLSLALAASARGPVLLIDADCWRPRVSEYLGLKSSCGVSDLLLEPAMDIDSCIAKVGNLDVMSGGTPLLNPVGLLASPRARQVLEQLRQKYRLVVLDSPPIVPAADSHVLAGLADGTLLVVRARQTRRELFRRAIESLGATNILGVVLNDVNYGDTNYAYAYRYYQRECVGQR